jgi:hypothetical protein
LPKYLFIIRKYYVIQVSAENFEAQGTQQPGGVNPAVGQSEMVSVLKTLSNMQATPIVILIGGATVAGAFLLVRCLSLPSLTVRVELALEHFEGFKQCQGLRED